MKKIVFLSVACFAVLLGFSSSAVAAGTYCEDKVVKINQYSNGDVYFYLANSGTTGDPAFELASTTDATKGRQVSLLLAAYMSGKRIMVHTAAMADCSNIQYGTQVDMVLIED